MAKRPTARQALLEAQPASDDPMNRVIDRIHGQRIFGKLPLFVLGAGVSKGVVPLLSDIAWWLKRELEKPALGGAGAWVANHAAAIVQGPASRRQGAELFSALQDRSGPFLPIWKKFSKGFLIGGLEFDAGFKFPGLCSPDVAPTKSHRILAEMLVDRSAHVLSLNFDGLTRKAVNLAGSPCAALHNKKNIYTYFTAPTDAFTPAIIKIRGDVFYALCTNPACPLSEAPYPIDRLQSSSADPSEPKCPDCSSPDLELQFQFPGYRLKEEASHPTLWAARRFLASRISSIVIIGFSGRWDRYVLQFLFGLARERDLLIVDVKPPDSSSDLIERFRSIYYPSMPASTDAPPTERAVYARIPATADHFLATLKDAQL
jgi:NAD-dependent SIR2 family protein deacetylase